MILTLGQPILYLLFALVAAVLLTWWLYRETTPELAPARRWLLASLRGLTLFILLFLLAEPLFTRSTDQTVRPVLGILFDESQSMTLIEEDSSDTDFRFRDLIEQVRSATVNERVALFGFGGRGRDVPTLDSLNTDAARTNLSEGLEYVRGKLQGQPLGAVLLISDGRHMEGRNPEHVAENFPAPVITVVVGDTTVRQDIRIQQLLFNEISYAGREVPIQVRIRNEGFSPRPVRLTLSLEGEVLDQTTVSLPAPGSEMVSELTFVPESVGLFQYRIDVSRQEGELTYRNNSELLSLQILERERRVLLISGAPSPDASAFARMLSENADTKLKVLTQKAPGEYFEGSFTAEISPLERDSIPDLIIVVGYPTRETTQTDLDALTTALDAGTPLLYVVDRSGSLAVVQRSLSGYLPARPRIIRPDFVSGAFVPASRAHLHTVFDITDRKETASWSKLPPISLNLTTWDVAPGAITLASTLIRGISIDAPVLVVQHSRIARSALILASGLWQWRNVPEDLQRSSLRWTQLFTNLTEWLVTDEDDRLVRVSPGRNILDESEAVIFGGQVYDESLTPVSDASISVSVTTPEGEVYPYQMQTLGNGRYRVDIGSLPEGTYSYTASASRDGVEVGSDGGTFSVGELSSEFRTPYADPILMQRLARLSGGFTIEPGELSNLSARLAALPSYASREIHIESRHRLWRLLPFLLLLVILMTAEWFLRKRFGLV